MTAAVADALLAAARALIPVLPGEALAVPAPADYGRGATLFVTVDQVEHGRRQRAGFAAITQIEHLELLLALPMGMPIPVESLAARERKALHRLPVGTVYVAQGQVVRLAARPVRVHLTLVVGLVSETSIGTASGFAPFCARAISTPTRPREEILTEADFWGIGVAHHGEALVKPAPWRAMRHTAAGWLFAEHAYQQVLSAA